MPPPGTLPARRAALHIALSYATTHRAHPTAHTTAFDALADQLELPRLTWQRDINPHAPTRAIYTGQPTPTGTTTDIEHWAHTLELERTPSPQEGIDGYTLRSPRGDQLRVVRVTDELRWAFSIIVRPHDGDAVYLPGFDDPWA